ncbi:MAG: RNA-binding domain-containing protein [Candidatus Altiarchaeota archaeon]
MKLIRSVNLSLFSKTGFIEKDKIALANILPEDAVVEQQTLPPELEGEIFTREITILTAKITKSKSAEDFFLSLLKKMIREDRRKLDETLKERISDGTLYLRVEKEAALAGAIKLTYAGDSIHLKIKIAAYPKTDENVFNNMKELLK